MCCAPLQRQERAVRFYLCSLEQNRNDERGTLLSPCPPRPLGKCFPCCRGFLMLTFLQILRPLYFSSLLTFFSLFTSSVSPLSLPLQHFPLLTFIFYHLIFNFFVLYVSLSESLAVTQTSVLLMTCSVFLTSAILAPVLL